MQGSIAALPYSRIQLLLCCEYLIIIDDDAHLVAEPEPIACHGDPVLFNADEMRVTVPIKDSAQCMMYDA